ncbi:MAG: TraV family lipoprotein [Brevundimonas aurantiaca]|jgi:conjugal transfer pilus assembly protein TraV|uniref:TraV family lipoprotein n=1 Tax=Brevundimonas aurantiaca TaxID=74316 RepID=UPI004033EFCF
MRGLVVVLMSSLAVSACSLSTNTKGNWSCSAPTGSSCASIDAIDHSADAGRPSPASPGVANAAPVRWWEPQPFVFSEAPGPRREGDQVMRVVFAPWVDAQGDYHGRSEVHAVMRRGGWWVAAPTAAPSSQAAPVSRQPQPPAAEAAGASE